MAVLFFAAFKMKTLASRYKAQIVIANVQSSTALVLTFLPLTGPPKIKCVGWISGKGV
jgi:hypothetical protein